MAGVDDIRADELRVLKAAREFAARYAHEGDGQRIDEIVRAPLGDMDDATRQFVLAALDLHATRSQVERDQAVRQAEAATSALQRAVTLHNLIVRSVATAPPNNTPSDGES